MNIIDRPVARWHSSVDWLRSRSSRFDHLWRARQRFNFVLAPRLAAAIAYYGFFAAFALGVVAYAILGFVLAGNESAEQTANAWLTHNLPFLDPRTIAGARGTVAVLGLIGLVLAGVSWVDGMRSAQRAVWQLDQQPGNMLIRRLVDLAMLVGLGLLLALSLWATSGINDLTGFFLSKTAATRNTSSGVLRGVGEAVSFVINLVMSAGMLIAVPRLRVSWRRIIWSVLLVGVGVTLLNTVGRIYVAHTEHNPAYRLAGAAVGLLVFLDLFSQVLLFGAALAATNRYGTVSDLA